MKRYIFAVLALAGALLAGCGGGGGSRTIPSGGSGLVNQNVSVPAQLQIANWGQGAMQGATYAGPATNAHLSVVVQVHQQNAQGLVQYAQSVEDPSSPNFHKWLTPQEIGQRFGATPANYLAVAKYFAQNGLTVTGWPQRLVLIVSGTQTAVEHAFNTKLGMYQRGGSEFIAPRTAPYFSQALPVDSIGRIAAVHADHRFLIPGGPRAGAGYVNGFSPSTIQAAQDFNGAYKAGYNGTGITIGIIGTGPLATTATAPYDADLAAFSADTNAQVAPVSFRLVGNSGVGAGLNDSGISAPNFPYSATFTPTPGPSAGCPSWGECNEDGEAQLDTQQAASLAPGSNVYFYFAYNPNDGCSGANFATACPAGSGQLEDGIDEADAEIQQAIGEDDADVISISFGGGDIQQGWTGYEGGSAPYVTSYSQLEYAALEVEGVAVFASSGDSGSAECWNNQTNTYETEQCVTYPADDPNVTGVGGVTMNVDLAGQITAPWLAWGIATSDNGYGGLEGSGGGTSTFFPVNTTYDPWQVTTLGATMREQPDVSMDGDPSTGVAVVCQDAAEGCAGGTSLNVIGGTSVAAPDMAAMWADVLSACVQRPSVGACQQGKAGPHGGWRLGNASPYLYAIYSNSTGYAKAQYKINGWTPSLTYTNVFYDIVYGDNEMYAGSNPQSPSPQPVVPGYQAGPGYDEVTGVGVPFAGHLIDAMLGTNVP